MNKINVESPATGTVWKIVKKVGDTVNEDDEILILESMKMEIPVNPPSSGRIAEILVQEGASVEEEQTLVIIDK